MIVKVTKDNYNEIVKENSKTVVIDFWAPWCGPCMALSPILEEVVTKDENIVVAKINVDDEPDLAQEYQVRSIPALFFVKEGEVKEKLVGLTTSDNIISIVTKL